jgi:spermidine synthase
MVARRGLAPLAICFFLSGMGSLALEVVWTRQMRLVFGSTTLAASTILVAYMLGLGLGGLVGGRRASRLRDGVHTYGVIEIVIGLYALAVPFLLRLLPELNRTFLAGLDFWTAALCRFVVVLALLLVPTVLMGATLPIVVTALVQREPRIGESTGLLYGLNTLGAVAGVFVATFALFPFLGLAWTNAFGALLDVAVGVIAIALVAPQVRAWPVVAPADVAAAPTSAPASDAAPRGAHAAYGDDARATHVPAWLLLTVYAVVGFSALLYEVAWTRALAVVLGSSIYAFSSMLGAFLTGIALGALLFRRWVDRTRAPHLLLAGGIALLAVLGLATTLAMPHLPDVFLRYFATPDHAPGRFLAAQVALSMLAMLPPTLVLGGLFPLVTRLVADERRDAGRAVGRVYFANTIGSASGAFVTGFALIPWLGLRDTLALGVGLDLAAAAALLLIAGRARRFAYAGAAAAIAGCVALALVPIPFDRDAFTRGVFKSPDLALDFGVEYLPLEEVRDRELLYYRDGINATVSVHRGGGTLFLRVNGKPDASSRDDMSTQVMLGEVPLLFGPPAKNVLVIGYASGVTVGSVARHPEVERIDAVEIEPAIVEASRYFDFVSGAPLDDPRVHLILDDARSYLASSGRRWDVIISEPSNPWMSGVSNLFTREFFQTVRGALAPGGRLLQWVQLYAMDPEALRSILAALRAEFPYVYGFANEEGGADLLLLAMDRELTRADLPRWENLPERVRHDLERVGTYSTADLWSLVRLLPADVDALVGEATVVNTDDNLAVELGTPLMLHQDTLTPNWEAFARFPRGVLPLLERDGEPLDADTLGALALSYMARRKDPAVAPTLLRTAAQRGPSNAATVAAVTLGRAVNVDGSFSPENQVATLDDVLARAPQDFEALLLRAQVLLESERHDEALACADAALAVRPDEPRALRVRADALVALERAEVARAATGARRR